MTVSTAGRLNKSHSARTSPRTAACCWRWAWRLAAGVSTPHRWRGCPAAGARVFGAKASARTCDWPAATAFDAVMARWDWSSAVGWDYPMLAMTAMRLGRPADAIDALMWMWDSPTARECASLLWAFSPQTPLRRKRVPLPGLAGRVIRPVLPRERRPAAGGGHGGWRLG
eukprot:COSAG04_NODE_845_length_9916_cov_16.855455_5_plen_170_part_00